MEAVNLSNVEALEKLTITHNVNTICIMVTLLMLFASVTQTFHLPQGLLSSICFVESSHRVNVKHLDDGGSSSIGVCEIKLNTARMLGYRGTEAGLMDFRTNIYYSGKYLRHQLTRYSENPYKAVAAYNAGSYREKYAGMPINKNYVLRVYRVWKRQK